MGIPILGICYDLHLLIQQLGGEVKAASRHEYGKTPFQARKQHPLFQGIPQKTQTWMSHGDRVLRLPEGFEDIGSPTGSAVSHREKPIFGLQFHPEVEHTKEGRQILANFTEEAIRRNAPEREGETDEIMHGAAPAPPSKPGSANRRSSLLYWEQPLKRS